MFNVEVVSYSVSKNPSLAQTFDMLSEAFKGNKHLNGLIFHSDQGWQYQMRAYQNMLKEHGIKQSMPRKENCLDNSMMENFFGLMKKEMFFGHQFYFKDYEQFMLAIE